LRHRHEPDLGRGHAKRDDIDRPVQHRQISDGVRLDKSCTQKNCAFRNSTAWPSILNSPKKIGSGSSSANSRHRIDPVIFVELREKYKDDPTRIDGSDEALQRLRDQSGGRLFADDDPDPIFFGLFKMLGQASNCETRSSSGCTIYPSRTPSDIAGAGLADQYHPALHGRDPDLAHGDDAKRPATPPSDE